MNKVWMILLGALAVSSVARADEVNVAVAANFAEPIKEIAKQFQQTTGHRLVISTGATGKFYAQIKNGAPFDVLLAADQETPTKLEQEGNAVAGTRFTYAVGELVLWSAQPNVVDSNGAVLRGQSFAHLAMANPKLAPYGRAAQQTLERMGLMEQVRPKLVTGENIGQTYQFVYTGNAQLGFVARSQVQSDRGISGSYWLIHKNMYSPIIQQAIILNHGKDNAGAKQLMQHLKTPAAKNIIRRYGYGV